MITFQVVNLSTVMTNDALNAILEAIEAQVADDVGPIWNVPPIKFEAVADKNSFTTGAWRFVVADNSDQADAAGYHDYQDAEPIGYAFVKSTIDAGMMPSVTISHEVLEMIGDPYINTSIQWSAGANALWLSQELGDPVEDDALGYRHVDHPDVQLSNFVTPAYFIPGSAGPWDFKNVLKAPNTLADGGYQLEWTQAKGWTQQSAFKQMDGGSRSLGRAGEEFANPYSRRMRRVYLARARAEYALG